MPFHQQSYLFDAGSLGVLEGLTLSQQSSSSSNNAPLIHYFGGLPYAFPPTGPYRFRQPRPLPPFYRYGTKANPGRFTRQAATCPQPGTFIGDPDRTFFDEDCLQLNIYIPANKKRPSNGWPVFFYIHGGFLQWGSPNMTPQALTPLLSETAFNAIIVMPGYRLNLFGFLASKELQADGEALGESCGNYGFWDQRCALEWAANNISHFGGDASNITVAGYSAGSHSAFHQLAHELYFVQNERAVIRRAIMWSNSPGVQPRTPADHQEQFDELLETLNIPSSLSADQKLDKLRSVDINDLVDAQNRLKRSEFRATSDGLFVSLDLMDKIRSGDFGRRMKQRGIKLMNGECRDEHFLYQAWRTPEDSYDGVRTRLVADYPEEVVDKLLRYNCGDTQTLPSNIQDWPDLFGRIYAEMQVHSLERGFHQALKLGGLEFGTDILRYRFDWRAKCVDSIIRPEWKVTHATDMAIWFWGLDYGEGLTDQEKQILRPWNKALAAFVHGDQDPMWGTKHIKEMRRLRSDGQTDTWIDADWEQGLRISDLVYAAANGVSGLVKSKL